MVLPIRRESNPSTFSLLTQIDIQTILIAPFAAIAWFAMPKTSAVAEDLPGSEKWKRMDLGGVSILVAGLIL
jgi:hypothetical protein